MHSVTDRSVSHKRPVFHLQSKTVVSGQAATTRQEREGEVIPDTQLPGFVLLGHFGIEGLGIQQRDFPSGEGCFVDRVRVRSLRLTWRGLVRWERRASPSLLCQEERVRGKEREDEFTLPPSATATATAEKAVEHLEWVFKACVPYWNVHNTF